jgi:hypothetical protein
MYLIQIKHAQIKFLSVVFGQCSVDGVHPMSMLGFTCPSETRGKVAAASTGFIPIYATPVLDY